MAKKNLTKELIELIQSGDYDLVQQLNGGEEVPYEGCTHNLFMWLESGEAKVKLLKPTDPHARENTKTYSVEFTSFMGDYVLTIWEI